MFKNFFKTAFRNLIKQKFFTLLNLSGLIAGFSCAILILLYVSHESNYDRFHENSERIFRIDGEMNYGGIVFHTTGLSAGFGPIVKENDFRVEDFFRVYSLNTNILKTLNSDPYTEEGVRFVDASFLNNLDFKIISGVPTEFKQPGKVFLTEDMARKYFGTTDIIGETLQLNKEYELTIAGVIAPAPSNTTFEYEILISFPTLATIEESKSYYEDNKMQLGSFFTYLVLDKPESKADVLATINNLNEDKQSTYYLESLEDLHVGGNFGNKTIETNIDIFLIIGLLILLLAVINYVNLTTARATVRAKEIGVRKVIGAGKGTLTFQFYLESSIMVLFAYLLSLGVVLILKPVMENYLGIQMDSSFILSPYFTKLAVITLLSSIILSGLYPSIIMNQFKPVQILKGKVSGKGKNNWLQKSFSTFQFSVAIALVFASIIIYQQIQLLKSQDPGLDKDQVMVIDLAESDGMGYEFLKNELSSQSQIKSVSASSLALFSGGFSTYFTTKPGTEEEVSINYMEIDEDYLATLGIPWSKEPESPVNPGDLLLNDIATEILGIEESYQDQVLQLGNNSNSIKGVVKDFNYTSAKSGISPLAMKIVPDSSGAMVKYGASMYLKLSKGSKLSEMIPFIESKIKDFQPGSPFEYYFLDEAFDRSIQNEQRLAFLFQVFTLLAIVIACLGLLGLVTFSLERRVKEIGIRKVLGASTQKLVAMIFSDYLILFLLSILIAIPVAWIGMTKWLDNFIVKYEIMPIVAVIASLAVFILGFITVASKAWLASQKDPAESLRYE